MLNRRGILGGFFASLFAPRASIESVIEPQKFVQGASVLLEAKPLEFYLPTEKIREIATTATQSILSRMTQQTIVENGVSRIVLALDSKEEIDWFENCATTG